MVAAMITGVAAILIALIGAVGLVCLTNPTLDQLVQADGSRQAELEASLEALRSSEADARISRDFAETVINSLPGIFYVFDVDGRFLRWNRNVEVITGYDADELAEMTPADFFREEDQPMIAERMREVFQRGIATTRANYVFKDGRSAPFFFTGLRFESKGRQLLIGFGIDVSEQVRAETKLRQHAKRLEMIGEIMEAALEASSTHQIAEAVLNRIEGLVPCERSSVVLFDKQLKTATLLAAHGHPNTSLKIGSDLPIEMFGRINLLRQGKANQINDLGAVDTPTVPQQILFKEGVRAYVSVPLRVEGELVGTLNVARGAPHMISAEHLTVACEVARPLALGIRQAQLHAEVLAHTVTLESRVAERTRQLEVAKEQAEAADRVKSAFLATMSHELRTPLNSIIGFTGIICKGLTGPINDEQAKQLGMVQGSARHLLSLINDVLDISKIEAGQLEVRMAPCDYRAAIEKAVNTVMPAAEQKHLRIRTQVAAEVGEVVADVRRVEQVLLNLINNAVKFTDVGEVLVDCEIRDAKVVTRIVDTGCGIKREDLSRLFIPFQQLDTGTARQHEGTGLGLAICHRLVNLMGGTISVDSTPGQGSRFSFTLPLHVATDSPAQPAKR